LRGKPRAQGDSPAALFNAVGPDAVGQGAMSRNSPALRAYSMT